VWLQPRHGRNPFVSERGRRPGSCRAGRPLKKFYAFRAMAGMLETPRRLPVTGADTVGLAVLAGLSRDGKTLRVLPPQR
jgi:hypothetical protein